MTEPAIKAKRLLNVAGTAAWLLVGLIRPDLLRFSGLATCSVVWRRLSLPYAKAAIIGPAGGRSFANLLRFWGRARLRDRAVADVQAAKCA
jgi:hypothetical protein